MIVDLSDREIFPSFQQLPDENDLNEDFYDTDNGFEYQPSHHWCLLAEIEEVEFLVRLRLVVRDVDGHKFPLAFYLEDLDDSRGGSLDMSQFKKGHTIAVMYAHQHAFMDFSNGIRLEDSKMFKVFPVSLATVVRLNEQVQERHADVANDTCHTCAQRADKPKRCGACGLAIYCSKECQIQAWQDTHKKECKQLKHLKGLFRFDWHQFIDFESVPT